MTRAQRKLVEKIDQLVTTPTDSNQVQFERHLQCQQSLNLCRGITKLLGRRNHRVEHGEPLSLPTSVLPPMF